MTYNYIPNNKYVCYSIFPQLVLAQHRANRPLDLELSADRTQFGMTRKRSSFSSEVWRVQDNCLVGLLFKRNTAFGQFASLSPTPSFSYRADATARQPLGLQ